MKLLRGIVLVPIPLALACGVASAQAPPPCDGDSLQRIGPVEVRETNHNAEYLVNLQPCQTLSVEVTADGDARYGANIVIDVLNQQGTPRSLFKTNWASYGPTQKTLPIGTVWVPPYRGTRGAAGLPGTLKINVQQLNGSIAHYTIDLVKRKRASYNIGGDAFSNAPTIPAHTAYYGSLHQFESGQFYKIHLEPDETISLKGQAMGSPVNGGGFKAELYDASQVRIKTLVNLAAYGTAPFPTGGNNWYTNGAAPADFYLKMSAFIYPVHDFQFSVGEVWSPRLTLFLDANGDFETNHEDDAPTYVPGAIQGGGISVPVVPEGEPLQQVRLIAAFVNDSGEIVPPPAGVTGVQFELQETSNFTGYAMNAGTSFAPDFVLRSGSAPFLENPASVPLDVFDYGGFTKVVATQASRRAEISIPKDDDSNWISDGGWKAEAVPVDDPGFPSSVDQDSLPPSVSYPSRQWGLAGDGLTAFEEYRGFVVEGVHTRTNPDNKDLFVTFDPVWRIGYAENLRLGGIFVHQIRGAISGFSVMEHDSSGVINWCRWNDGPGGNVPGPEGPYAPQKALRISLTDQYQPGYFGFTNPLQVDPKVPIDVTSIDIWVESIMTLADPEDYVIILGEDAPAPYTVEQAENEVRRTFAHEVGHGIAICHPGGCAALGIDESGRPSSVMGGVAGGPPETDPLSMYSEFEFGLARFHRRF